MAFTTDQFVQLIADSGLMTAEDVRTFVAGLPNDQQPADGESLAKQLVALKQLTPFQAQQIWKGKGKSLVLGDYLISDKIGAGGMGMVFKAQHRLMKREVALKVLPPAVTKDENAVMRFLREVEAAAKLTHANIVAANDAREGNGAYYLIMEYVEGRDLSEIVRKQGPATIEQAIDFTLQTARGLEYAHQNGVIHRDIKPANLLLDKSGTVKILDMGLARIEDNSVDAATQAGLTGTGTIMGTVDYMAPEQAEDTKSAGPQADIYSLGATLYYLLVAKPVISGDTMGKKLKVLMTGVGFPDSISAERTGIQAELDTVFRRMTAFENSERYQSMGEVIADLEALQKGGITGSPSVAGVTPVSAERSEDSAINSFVNSLDEETSATAQTVVASHEFREPSDTFAGSVGEMTRPTLSKTVALGRTSNKQGRRNLIMGGSAAAVAVLGLILWSFSGGNTDQPSKPEGNKGLAGESSKTAIPNQDVAEDRQVGVDLLKNINLPQDVVSGDFSLTDGKLSWRSENFSRLQIPLDVPDEYDLVLSVSSNENRTAGLGSGLAIGLLVDGHQVMTALDFKKGSGLELLDGNPYTQNETLLEEFRLLPPSKKSDIVCQVRKSSVTVTLNGRVLIDWKGETSRLSTVYHSWEVPDERALFVGGHSSYTISNLELRPVGSTTIDSRIITKSTITSIDDWVELLPLAQFKYDVPLGGGEWKREGVSLISPKQEFARISVPVAPRIHYQLKTAFTRIEGNDAVDIFLPIVSRPIVFVFDGFGGKGLSGLQAVDGKNEPNPQKGEGVAGFHLENGRTYTAEFTVTAEGDDATIEVLLNGKPFTKWSGPIASLSLIDEKLSLNDTRRLGVGAWNSVVRFDSMQLKILQGQAELFRPVSLKSLGPEFTDVSNIISPANGSVPLLPLIDPSRDTYSGTWNKSLNSISSNDDGAHDRIALPLQINGSYDLEFTFTRTSGTDALAVRLPVHETGVDLVISGWSNANGSKTSLQVINGIRGDSDKNPTLVRNFAVENGKQYNAQLHVQNDSESAEITVTMGGKQLISWKGSIEELTAPEEFPGTGKIAFMTAGVPIRIENLKLIMLDGHALLTRPNDSSKP